MAKFPIVMYHDISAFKSEEFIISTEKLEAQLAYLSANNYQTYHFKELKEKEQLDHDKNIIITFDGAYESQLALAYPLLKKYQFKATIFVPLGFIGKKDTIHTDSARIMSLETLKTLDPDIFELGFYSFGYRNYEELSLVNAEEDLKKCILFARENRLNMSSVLAYPDGKYPRENPKKGEFFEMLKDYGFQYGLRIGDKVNTFPFKNPYEVQRIDVQGDFSLGTFKRKLRYNRWF